MSRLIWTKGVDLAVAAVQRLRDHGENVVLRIAGDADVESPEALEPEENEERWSASASLRS